VQKYLHDRKSSKQKPKQFASGPGAAAAMSYDPEEEIKKISKLPGA
jgi:preprotein translocase subunit Sec61beta